MLTALVCNQGGKDFGSRQEHKSKLLTFKCHITNQDKSIHNRGFLPQSYALLWPSEPRSGSTSSNISQSRSCAEDLDTFSYPLVELCLSYQKISHNRLCRWTTASPGLVERYICPNFGQQILVPWGLFYAGLWDFADKEGLSNCPFSCDGTLMESSCRLRCTMESPLHGYQKATWILPSV